jgi:hypothetical protein
MLNETAIGEPALPLVLGEVMARGLAKVPGWTVQPTGVEPMKAGALARRGIRALELKAKVRKLTRKVAGGLVNFSSDLEIELSDRQGGSPGRLLHLNTRISTPVSPHQSAQDAFFYTDLIEVAGRQAVRRIVAKVSNYFPPRSPITSPDTP